MQLRRWFLWSSVSILMACGGKEKKTDTPVASSDAGAVVAVPDAVDVPEAPKPLEGALAPPREAWVLPEHPPHRGQPQRLQHPNWQPECQSFSPSRHKPSKCSRKTTKTSDATALITPLYQRFPPSPYSLGMPPSTAASLGSMGLEGNADIGV